MRPFPLLAEGSEVWVTMKDGIQVPGVVTEHADTPRSYVINTDEGGQVCRNRLHLKVIIAVPGVNTDNNGCEHQPNRKKEPQWRMTLNRKQFVLVHHTVYMSLHVVL